MTLTVEAAIYEALASRLEAFSIDADQIAWPGRAFDPVEGEVYLDVSYLPNQTATIAVGDDASRRYEGFLQVAVMYPATGSLKDALDYAGGVVAHFAKGTILASNGVLVRLERQPWIAPPLLEPGRFRVPVSIPYRVFYP